MFEWRSVHTGRYGPCGRSAGLKVLLRSGGPGVAEYIRLLHQAINDAIPSGPDGDVHVIRLRTGLAAITSRISEQASIDDIANAVDAATELLRKHHATVLQRGAQQLAELKAVMRTMTDTITFLSESRSTVVHQLTFVERQLEEATELEDIRLLRPRIAECLELVRQENARLQAESAAHTEAVRQKMGLSVSVPGEKSAVRKVGTLDIATGLPNRDAAERLIGEKASNGRRCSIALFVPERLGFVVRRHGREAEDEVLLHVAQHVTRLLPAGAHLYRWSGPSLLAVKPSSGAPEHEHQVWTQIASKPYEKTIGNERRSALLRITLACLVTHADIETPLAGLFEEMDQFVMQSTKE